MSDKDRSEINFVQCMFALSVRQYLVLLTELSIKVSALCVFAVLKVLLVVFKGCNSFLIFIFYRSWPCFIFSYFSNFFLQNRFNLV